MHPSRSSSLQIGHPLCLSLSLSLCLGQKGEEEEEAESRRCHFFSLHFQRLLTQLLFHVELEYRPFHSTNRFFASHFKVIDVVHSGSPSFTRSCVDEMIRSNFLFRSRERENEGYE